MKKRKRKTKPKPTARLSEKLLLEVRRQLKDMIEAVMYQTHDVWSLIDEIVQEDYAGDGDAWLEVNGPASVLCSIGSGDAVFSLPLDTDILIDDANAPQGDNQRRLTHLDALISSLQEVRQKLVTAIGE